MGQVTRYIVGSFYSDVFDSMPVNVQYKFIKDIASKGENKVECKTHLEALHWCCLLNFSDGTHGYVYDTVTEHATVTDIRVISHEK